ncbi:hypothetical protein PoB_002657500 [Plakobranchus ocellatus]|uniref:Uncharacterized protein n=1 Tax=Plakobranchus ocellatus TaxID=259542 RepID=A0AAV3ZW22_9GAST|nr:hypothetical protein PoB_002657500 [Plakobranchus ocellatus]
MSQKLVSNRSCADNLMISEKQRVALWIVLDLEISGGGVDNLMISEKQRVALWIVLDLEISGGGVGNGSSAWVYQVTYTASNPQGDSHSHRAQSNTYTTTIINDNNNEDDDDDDDDDNDDDDGGDDLESTCDKQGDIGGPVDSVSALRYSETFLSQFRATPPIPRPDGGPESLRSLVMD